MNLSVICPAIRVERWPDMYKAIYYSFIGQWELVIITEKEIPPELKNCVWMRFIHSERSPMAKQQMALESARGEYITVCSDDSLFHPGMLDKSFELVRAVNDYKTIVIMKYLEGPELPNPDHRYRTSHGFMMHNDYYMLKNHRDCQLVGIPDDAPLLSCAIISKRLLLEVGGWDTVFQTQAIANVDLSARLMKHGAKYIIQEHVSSSCTWTPGKEEGHGPLHYAQIEDDQPLLNNMYALHSDRIKIPIDNWNNSPEIWPRKHAKT